MVCGVANAAAKAYNKQAEYLLMQIAQIASSNVKSFCGLIPSKPIDIVCIVWYDIVTERRSVAVS